MATTLFFLPKEGILAVGCFDGDGVALDWVLTIAELEASTLCKDALPYLAWRGCDFPVKGSLANDSS